MRENFDLHRKHGWSVANAKSIAATTVINPSINHLFPNIYRNSGLKFLLIATLLLLGAIVGYGQTITATPATADICAGGSLIVTATPAGCTPAASCSVNWSVLNSNGTFTNSASAVTDYFPNPLSPVAERVDTVLATLVETHDVTWTNESGVNISGNMLTKSASNGWNAGANTIQIIPANSNGWIEFKATLGDYVAVGLSNNFGDYNYDQIEFAIVQLNDKVYPSENGVFKIVGGGIPMVDGDTFRVERVDDSLFYKQNGTIFYTSLQTSTTSLVGDVSLNVMGNVIMDATISVPPLGSTPETDTIFVTVEVPPFIDLTAAGNVCEGDSIKIDTSLMAPATFFTMVADSGVYNKASSYYIPKRPVATLTRMDTLIGTTNNPSGGCTAGVDTLIIEVLQNDSIGADGGVRMDEVCEGDTVAINTTLYKASTTKSVDWTIHTGTGTIVFPNPLDKTDIKYVPKADLALPNPRIDTLIYKVDPTGNCGIAQDSFFVTVHKAGILDLIADLSVCETDSILVDTLAFGGGATSITWSTNVAPAGDVNSNSGYYIPFTPILVTSEHDTIIAEAIGHNTTFCPTLKDTVPIEIFQIPGVSIITPANPTHDICEGETLPLKIDLDGSAIGYTWTLLNGPGTLTTITSDSTHYVPSLISSGVSRVDTLIAKADNTTYCTGKTDTLFLTIHQAPSISLSLAVGLTSVIEGDSIKIDTAIGGGATSFTPSYNAGNSSTYNQATSYYIPAPLASGFSRIDTLIGTTTGQDASCPAAVFKLPILVYRSASITIITPPGDLEECSGDTLGLTAVPDPPFPISTVVWEELNGNGTFDDSLSLTPIYTPNPLTVNVDREDFLVVTLIESRPVYWIDVNNASATVNSLKRTTGTGYGGSGARSMNTLPAGQSGFVEMTASPNNNYVLGFSNTNINDDYDRIDFGLRQEGTEIYVVENNVVQSGTNITFTNGDVFQIERVGVKVSYKHNGTVFFTSSTNFGGVLLVDAAIEAANDSIKEVRTSIMPPGRVIQKDTVVATIKFTPILDLGADLMICEGDSAAISFSIIPSATLLDTIVADSGYYNPATGYYIPNLPIPGVTRVDTLIGFTDVFGSCPAGVDTLLVTVKQQDSVATNTMATYAPSKMLIICEGDTTDAATQMIKMDLFKAAVGKSVRWTLHAGTGTIIYPNTDTTQIRYLAAVDPSTSASRIDTLIANVYPAGCNIAQDSVFITVNKAPTISVSGPIMDVCFGDSVRIDTILGSGADSYTVSVRRGTSAGIATDYDRTTGYYTPDVALTNPTRNDTVFFTTTNSLGCMNVTDTFPLVVYRQPTVDIINPGVPLANRCDGDSLFVMASLLTGATSLQWSTLHNTGTFGDDTLASTMYFPNPLGGLAERYDTIVVTTNTNGPCLGGKDTVVLRVRETATLTLASIGTVCEGDSIEISFALGGSATGLETGYPMIRSGGLSAANYNATSMYYMPTGAVSGMRVDTIVFLTNDPVGPCPPARDSVLITVYEQPTVMITNPNKAPTDPANRCDMDSLFVQANLTDGEVTWSTLHNTGSFGDDTLNMTMYFPNPLGASLTERYDTIVVTTNPNGVCLGGKDTIVLKIWEKATLSLTTDNMACEGDSTMISFTIGGSVSMLETGWPEARSGAAYPAPSGAGTYNATSMYYTPVTPVIGGMRIDTVVFLTEVAPGPCPAIKDSVFITVTESDAIATMNPIAATKDTTVCEADTAFVKMSLTKGALAVGKSVVWSQLSGTGTFVTVDSVTAKYVPAIDASVTGTTLRIDTLIATVDPINACGSVNDTVFVTVNKIPTLALSSAGFVYEGDSIKIDTIVGGGATSFSITTINIEGGGGVPADYNQATSYYTPGGAVSGFSRVDTLIGSTPTGGVCDPAIDTLLITVFRNSSLTITIPLGNEDLCAGDTLDLVAVPVPGSLDVVWEELHGNGTFDDSLSLTPEYYPNPLATTVDRMDTLVVSLIESREVIWVDDNNVTIAGSDLTKMVGAGNSWGNAGARSQYELASGENGYVEMEITGDYNIALGLSATNPDDHYLSIDYGIFQDPDNFEVYVVENGIPQAGTTMPYVATEIFRIERVGTTVYYKKNGVIFYTSTTPSTGILFADTALEEEGDMINNVFTSILPTGAIVKKDTIVATIKVAPILDLGMDSIMVCEEDSILINLTITPNTVSLASSISNNGIFNLTNNYYTPNVPLTTLTRIDTLIATTDAYGSCAGAIDSLIIVVKQKDSLVTVGANKNKFVCEGGTVGASVMPTKAAVGKSTEWQIHSGMGTITYVSADSTQITYTPDPNPAITNTDVRWDTLIAQVKSTSTCGIAQDTVFVRVRKATSLTPIADMSVCEGETIVLESTPGGSADTVFWGFGTNPITGTFNPANGITEDTIEYTPDPLALATSSRIDKLYFIADTLYPVCPGVIDSVEITVYQAPDVEIMGPNPKFVCDNDTLLIQGTIMSDMGSVPGITWVLQDPASGTILNPDSLMNDAQYIPSEITGTATMRTDIIYLIGDANPSCEPDTAMLTVQIRRAPEVMPIANQAICLGDSILLSSQPGPAVDLVSWSSKPGLGGNFDADNATAFDTTYFSTYAFTGTEVSISDTIYYTATNSFLVCGPVTDSVIITVSDSIDIQLLINPTIYMCEDDSKKLQADVSNDNVGMTWVMANPALGAITNPTDTTNAFYDPAPITGTATTRTDVIYAISDMNGACPPDTATLNVVVRRATTITPNPVPDLTVCEGDSVLMSAMPGGSADTLFWVVNDIDSSAINPMNGIGNDVYYIPKGVLSNPTRVDTMFVLTDTTYAVCPGIVDTFLITVMQADSVYNTFDNKAVCEGDSIDMDAILAKGATDLLWTIHNGSGTILYDDSTKATYVPNPGVITGNTRRDTLFVETVPSSGCAPFRDTVVVRVRRAALLALSQDTTICESDFATLKATPAGSARKVDNWTLLSGTFGTPPNYATDDTLTFSYIPAMVIAPALTRIDTIIATSDNPGGVCPAVQDTIIVTVTNGVDISVVDNQVFVCEGGSVDVAAMIDSGATSITWSLITNHTGNGTIADPNSLMTEYTPINIATGNTRRDTLMVTSNSFGGCTADVELVEVVVRKPVSLSEIRDTFQCGIPGAPIELSTTLSGAGSRMQWEILGSTIDAIDTTNAGNTYTFDFDTTTMGVVRVDTIIYRAESQFFVCDDFVDTILVTIFPSPILTIDPSYGNNPADIDTVVVCEGGMVPVEASANGGVPTVLWSSASGSFTDPTDTSSMYIPDPGQTTNTRYDKIYIHGTGATGCGPIKDSLIVKVRRAPMLSAYPDTLVCEGGVLALSATTTNVGRGDTIFWEIIDGTAGGNLSTPQYTTVENGILSIDYTPTSIGSNTIRYYTDKPAGVCPIEEDTFVINVFQESGIQIGLANVFDRVRACEGVAIPISATIIGGATSATWSGGSGSIAAPTSLITEYTPSSVLTGSVRYDTLYITTNAAPGCTPAKDSMIVEVYQSTGLTTAAPAITCLGSPVTISAQTTGFPRSISWIRIDGSGILSRNTTSGTQTLTYTPDGTNTGFSRVDTLLYTVINPQSPCTPVSKKVAITVNPASIVDAGPVNLIEICEGGSVTLNGSSSGGTFSTLWTGGNGLIANPNSLVTMYTPTTGLTTNFRDDVLTITSTGNAFGCAAVSDVVTVRVHRAASLTTASPVATCLGNPVSLSAQSTGIGSTVTWTVLEGSGSFNGSASIATTGTQTANYTPSGVVVGTTRIDTLVYSTVNPAAPCTPVAKKVAVTVHRPAVIEAADPAIAYDVVRVCEGGTVALDGGHDGTLTGVNWSVIGATGVISGIINDTIGIYTPFPVTSGTQRVDRLVITGQSSSTFCPIVKDTLDVIVEKVPTITATPDSLNVCEGDAILLFGTTTGNASGITWMPKVPGSGTIASVSANIATYEPLGAVTGTYREDIIYFTSVNSTTTCPAAIDSMKVLVSAKPSLELGTDRTLCINGGNIIIPQTLGQGNQLTWSANSGYVDANNAYFQIDPVPAVTRQDAVFATATDTFGVCAGVTDNIVVTMTETVRIFINDNTPVCEFDTLVIDPSYSGLPTSFTSSVTNNNGQVILHNFQVVFIPNENVTNNTRTDRIIINNLDVDGAGICTGFSDTVFVDVLNAAKVELIADTTICDGDKIDLDIDVFGQEAFFQSKYSTSLVNYPNNPPVLTDKAVIDTVIYSSYLTNGGCPTATDTVIVKIAPNGTVALNLPDAMICEANTLALNSGITDASIDHHWEVLGNVGSFDNATSATPVYTPVSGLTTASRVDTIILTALKDGTTCYSGVDTMLVTVTQSATLSNLADTTMCFGPLLAINLTLNGAATLNWTSNNGTFSNTTNPVTSYIPQLLTTPTRVDTLWATLTFPGGGCSTASRRTLVTLFGQMEVDAGVDSTICAGFDYQLDASLNINTGLDSVQWTALNSAGTFNNDNTVDAVYTPAPLIGVSQRVDELVLSTYSAFGCLVDTDTVMITVISTPSVSLGPDRTVFDIQDIMIMATLDAKVKQSTWSSNNGTFAGSTLDETDYIPNALGVLTSRLDEIIYEAEFVNPTCANVRDTLYLTVQTPPTISRGQNDVYCQSLCIDSLMLSIDDNTGTLVVLASDLDPTDNCVPDLGFDYRFWYEGIGTLEPTSVMDFPNLPPSITFDCTDRGFQELNVYVAEDPMTIQLCPVVIEVEDELIACGERTVSGRITTRTGDPVVGFDVFVENAGTVGGIVPDPVQTDVDGFYSVVVKTDRDYRIKPKNDELVANGVTAFDNVGISRHILALEPFTSPYQVIAADVNKSGTVTAFDIVLIRKVVLARENSFINNESWRFVEANFPFPNLQVAASEPFTGTTLITPDMGNTTNIDFTAVKVGDVNNTAKLGTVGTGVLTSAESRNSLDNIVFQTNNLQVESGQVFEVPFQLLNGEKVESYQFTLDFEGLELLSIKDGVATPEHFGLTLKDRGKLAACWSSATSESTSTDWFTLQFRATKDGRLSELLTLSSDVTPIEAYTKEFENVGISLDFVQPKVATLELFQNKPNPFKGQTVISFALPDAGDAQIRILDMQGKLLKNIKGNYSAGYNEVRINTNDLPRGVMYYRLETAFGTRVQKMMQVE